MLVEKFVLGAVWTSSRIDEATPMAQGVIVTSQILVPHRFVEDQTIVLADDGPLALATDAATIDRIHPTAPPRTPTVHAQRKGCLLKSKSPRHAAPYNLSKRYLLLEALNRDSM